MVAPVGWPHQQERKRSSSSRVKSEDQLIYGRRPWNWLQAFVPHLPGIEMQAAQAVDRARISGNMIVVERGLAQRGSAINGMKPCAWRNHVATSRP